MDRPCKSSIEEIEEFLESDIWQDILLILDEGSATQRRIGFEDATDYIDLVIARTMVLSADQFKEIPYALIERLKLYQEFLARPELKHEEEDDGSPE